MTGLAADRLAREYNSQGSSLNRTLLEAADNETGVDLLTLSYTEVASVLTLTIGLVNVLAIDSVLQTSEWLIKLQQMIFFVKRTIE